MPFGSEKKIHITNDYYIYTSNKAEVKFQIKYPTLCLTVIQCIHMVLDYYMHAFKS